jgi:hypothetical protein
MTNDDERDQPGSPQPGSPDPALPAEPPASDVPPNDAVPTGGRHAADQDDPQHPPRQGRMRYQDPSNTVPREPTLAESRARQQAEKQQRAAEEAQAAADARRRKIRKRVLIGGGVTVGIVAAVAIGYAVTRPDDVTARCVDENDVVVDDSNCVVEANSSNGYYGGGLYPIFLGVGGAQYHYNYGGSGNIGQRASGGTTVAPKNANVSTPSGKTVSRGGFGVSKGGSSSGGSSSGGSSSGS